MSIFDCFKWGLAKKYHYGTNLYQKGTFFSDRRPIGKVLLFMRLNSLYAANQARIKRYVPVRRQS